MGAMRDRGASTKRSRDVNCFRQFLLASTGFESRLPVNLDAINALRCKRNSNCHEFFILLWDRAISKRRFVVGPEGLRHFGREPRQFRQLFEIVHRLQDSFSL